MNPLLSKSLKWYLNIFWVAKSLSTIVLNFLMIVGSIYNFHWSSETSSNEAAIEMQVRFRIVFQFAEYFQVSMSIFILVLHLTVWGPIIIRQHWRNRINQLRFTTTHFKKGEIYQLLLKDPVDLTSQDCIKILSSERKRKGLKKSIIFFNYEWESIRSLLKDTSTIYILGYGTVVFMGFIKIKVFYSLLLFDLLVNWFLISS